MLDLAAGRGGVTSGAAGRLRVAVFHMLPPGGARRALYELVRRTSDRVDYHLLSVDLGAAERWADLRGRQDLAAVVTSVSEHRPRLLPRIGPLSRVLDTEAVRWLQRSLSRTVNAGGYDLLLVSHDQFLHSPALLRWVRTPTVYLCQEPRRRSFEPASATRHLPRALWAAEAAYECVLRARDVQAARAADVVVTNSTYTARYIGRVYSREAAVCHLGVDADALAGAGAPRSRNAVVSVGALDTVKGHDLVVEALGLLPPGGRPALDVVYERGHNSVGSDLRARAHDLGVDLRLHRSISDSALGELYTTASATVCAARLEPFGLTTVESLSCGTPVVAVNEGGFPEVVVDGANGRLVDRTPAAIAAGIADVLAHPPAPPDALRDSVLPYWSWDSAGARFLALLSAAAEPSGRRESSTAASHGRTADRPRPQEI